LIARKVRGITRYRITESIHSASVPFATVLPGLVWIPIRALASVPLSGPHRRWTNEILAARGF
jgi:A/G-specific adenine glycosylase